MVCAGSGKKFFFGSTVCGRGSTPRKVILSSGKKECRLWSWFEENVARTGLLETNGCWSKRER